MCKSYKYKAMKYVRKNPLHKTRIDFTPFVSIAFVLLSSFFALEILNKPKALIFNAISRYGCGFPMDNDQNNDRNIVLFLAEKEVYLCVNPYKDHSATRRISYGSVLGQLSQQKARVKRICSEDLLSVTIKPLASSNYGQLVGVLNDLKIAHISRYAMLPDVLDDDKLMMASAK